MSSARRSRREKQNNTNVPTNTNISNKTLTPFSLKGVFNSITKEITTFQESSKVKFVVRVVWLCDGMLNIIFYINIITLLFCYYRIKMKKVRSPQINKKNSNQKGVYEHVIKPVLACPLVLTCFSSKQKI